MSRKSFWIVLALLLAAIFVGGFLGYSFRNPNVTETFGEKSEWSILQEVEYGHRGSKLEGPTFITVGDYEVMGLSDLKGEPIWILLNPKSPPYYKQLPSLEGYSINVELVEQLQHEHRLGYTTYAALNSHLEPYTAKP